MNLDTVTAPGEGLSIRRFTRKVMLKKLLVWHCRPGGSQGGSVDRIFFFFYKKKWKFLLQIEMQAKFYAELTDDIFRYFSVPKNSLLTVGAAI